MSGGGVDFPVPVEVAYDYLVDPLQRPRWQSSLRAVELVDEGPVGEGFRWIDVTWPGLRPQMALTVADRPHRWVEHGRWRAFEAELSLDFTPTPTGCRVTPEFEVRASGPWAPLGVVASVMARRPVLADLRRAARILGSGS